jgi:peptidoglycan/xylan/chitin deacetylase (PgdA/CDA1 family)
LKTGNFHVEVIGPAVGLAFGPSFVPLFDTSTGANMAVFKLFQTTLLSLCLFFSHSSWASPTEALINDGQSVLTSLEKAKNAKSLFEFDQHLNHGLNQMIAKAKESSTTPEEVVESLCTQLELLKTEDLALLDSEIEDLFKELPRSCLKKLAVRLNGHWLQQRMSSPAFLMKRASRPFRVLQIPILQRQNRILNGLDLPPKHIMLTFDDGPREGTTSAVLDTLREFGAQAVFFSLGRNAKSNPAVAKRIVDEGHILASHTMHHPSLHRFIGRSFLDISTKSGHCFSPVVCSKIENSKSFDPRADRIWTLEDSIQDIRMGHLEVFKAAGMVWPFFRPPYGDDFSPSTAVAPIRDYLNKNDFWNFRWNMDSHDYKFTDRAQLVQNVISVIEGNGRRGIILFHDIKQVVPLALPEILKYLSDNDYTLVIPEDLPEEMLSETGTLVKEEPSLRQFRRKPRRAGTYSL